MLKEKGYDEFLVEQIRQGLEDYAQGRVISLEQAKALSQQAIQQKLRELEKFDHDELMIYG